MLKKRWQLTALAALILAALVTFAFYPTGAADPRQFDPERVARADAEMWRDYYEKRRLALFLHLTKLLHGSMDFHRANRFTRRLKRAARHLRSKTVTRAPITKMLCSASSVFIESSINAIRRRLTPSASRGSNSNGGSRIGNARRFRPMRWRRSRRNFIISRPRV